MQNVKYGDIIFSIPLDLVVWQSPLVIINSQDQAEDLDDFTSLALRLLNERTQREQSRYYPYIQVRSSQEDPDCCGAVRKRGSSI